MLLKHLNYIEAQKGERYITAMYGVMGNDVCKEVRSSSPFCIYSWCFGYQHMAQIMPSKLVTATVTIVYILPTQKACSLKSG